VIVETLAALAVCRACTARGFRTHHNDENI
jgi:hypothetical protein